FCLSPYDATDEEHQLRLAVKHSIESYNARVESETPIIDSNAIIVEVMDSEEEQHFGKGKGVAQGEYSEKFTNSRHFNGILSNKDSASNSGDDQSSSTRKRRSQTRKSSPKRTSTPVDGNFTPKPARVFVTPTPNGEDYKHKWKPFVLNKFSHPPSPPSDSSSSSSQSSSSSDSSSDSDSSIPSLNCRSRRKLRKEEDRVRRTLKKLNFNTPKYSGAPDIDLLDKFIYDFDNLVDIYQLDVKTALRVMPNYLFGDVHHFVRDIVGSGSEGWDLQSAYMAIFDFCFPPTFKEELRSKIVSAR
ncbi:hypothetical protein L218DRAFT_1005468, partial [Marasmius fiardii PR-910]